MNARTTLTKSLHTVSAVVSVVLLIRAQPNGETLTPDALVRTALSVLGQPCDWAATDPTFAACVAKVAKLVQP